VGASKGVVPGAEEAENLKKYHTVQHKLTFPIALWEGEKKRTDDGGMAPEKNPTWEAYGVFSFPQVVLVDTTGIIGKCFPRSRVTIRSACQRRSVSFGRK
jgi:hypothetical protein